MTKPLSKEVAKDTIDLINSLQNEGFKLEGRPNAVYEAGRRLKVSAQTVYSRLIAAERLYKLKPSKVKHVSPATAKETVELPEDFPLRIGEMLKKRRSIAELCSKTGAQIGQVLDAIEDLKTKGINVHRLGDNFEIVAIHQAAFEKGTAIKLVSRPDNTFLFGASGDLHAASKYARYDVRHDLYRQFVEAGAQCNFDTGNWIDGEARFNTYDIEAHGIDAQCRLLAENHPKYDGFHTYAVWGDDHEGWLAQREGMNVGKYNEAIMQEYGHEWTDLGFMEAHVELVNYNTGKSSMMAVVHPGGGSSYALSYSIQKIIESLEGGEKPAVGLYGHYHKIWSGIIRNVWVVQTGCCQDQTPFMRKKRLEAHVGGALVGLEQDPETGAILSMTPKLIRYFNKGYYEGRWSKHDAVNNPERSTKNIR